MGGGLYDASHSKDNLSTPQLGAPSTSPSSTPSKRPQLDARGFTERGPAAGASPKLLAADQTDESVQGVLLRSMSDMK
jgi:osomolarity two-component system sensor histidine kinase NIK1